MDLTKVLEATVSPGNVGKSLFQYAANLTVYICLKKHMAAVQVTSWMFIHTYFARNVALTVLSTNNF